jgi:hypothetical protein
MSLTVNQNNLTRTTAGSLCFPLPETNRILTQIQSSVNKILQGTNPQDNRNQLLTLNNNLTGLIASLNTFDSLDSTAKAAQAQPTLSTAAALPVTGTVAGPVIGSTTAMANQTLPGLPPPVHAANGWYMPTSEESLTHPYDIPPRFSYGPMHSPDPYGSIGSPRSPRSARSPQSYRQSYRNYRRSDY